MEKSEIIKAIVEGMKDPAVLKSLQELLVIPMMEEQCLKINDLEQYSRKANITVSGMPEHQDESVPGLVIELARILGVDLCPSDIVAAHRIGRKQQGKHRSIIVRFASFARREELYRERKNLRGVTLPRDTSFTPNMVKDVYIADNLTRYNSALMFACREMKRAGKLSAAWTDAGKVKVRVDNGPTRVIRSADNLRRLVGDHPALNIADDVLHGRQTWSRDGPVTPTPTSGPAPAVTPTPTPGPAPAETPNSSADADPAAATGPSPGASGPSPARADSGSSPTPDPRHGPTNHPTPSGDRPALRSSAGPAPDAQLRSPAAGAGGRSPAVCRSPARESQFGRRGRGKGRNK